MKTPKNSIYFKKLNFLFFKLCLWVAFGFIFLNFSFLMPINSYSNFRELVVFLFLFVIINLNTSYLYSVVFKKSRGLYMSLFVISVLVCTVFEIYLFSDVFDPSYFTFLDRNKLYISISCGVLLRNFVLFIFFLWVEYYNRLILLLYEKDEIKQKELSLLIEKQEFEKMYSRKRLLLHYFFNILELVQINTSVSNNKNELLEKIKFILYYFLVDAEQEKVELEKEIAFYNFYIDLEKLRHKEKIPVNFKIMGQPENYFIIPLLFEPLIGNAMKYTKQDGTGCVDILIEATQFPVLKFYCRNNYFPRSANMVSSESGLKILEHRLELFYKNKYTLKTIQNDVFYEVTLTIEVE